MASGAGLFRRLHPRPDRDAVAAYDGIFQPKLGCAIPLRAFGGRRRQCRLRDLPHSHRDRRTRRDGEGGLRPSHSRQADARRALREAYRGFQLCAERSRQDGDRAEPDPHRDRGLSRLAVHRALPRPARSSENPRLRQGRSSRRRDRRHRARRVRQGQRLRQEDHLSRRRRGPRASHSPVPQRLQSAHRRHRRHDRDRHRREADRGADLPARRQGRAIFRADEGARRAHDRAGETARGDARGRGQDALRADRCRRRHRESQVRLPAFGARPQDRLREAHRADRRRPARRGRVRDSGRAARGARPAHRRPRPLPHHDAGGHRSRGSRGKTPRRRRSRYFGPARADRTRPRPSRSASGSRRWTKPRASSTIPRCAAC